MAGHVDVLLVSPERLANPRFAATVLEVLLPRLGLLVIDEAHCISSWGHDFRPDYRRIAGLLLANPELPVLATTATANSRVTADVADQLGPTPSCCAARSHASRCTSGCSPVCRRSTATRGPTRRCACCPDPGSSTASRSPTPTASPGSSPIAVTRWRHTRGRPRPADRARIEEALKANELKAVVATSALGMGYDKPDLAFCIHVGSPSSPVDYYQQVGRAGRALPEASVVLLPGGARTSGCGSGSPRRASPSLTRRRRCSPHCATRAR